MANNPTITDEQVVERARVAVEIAIMKHKALGVPIVEYDRKTKKVYQKVKFSWQIQRNGRK